MRREAIVLLVLAVGAANCLGGGETHEVDRMLQSTTSSCNDPKCNSCYYSNRNYCVSCSLDTVGIVSGSDRLCSGCIGCLTTDCSINPVSPKSCTGGCASGYRTISSSTLVSNYCAKMPIAPTPANPGMAFLGFMIGFVVLYVLFFTLRWFCNESQHKQYCYENVVLPNQPPPFQSFPIQQPSYPM